ncbi:MAG: UDP-N-acetylmuramate dehydrogenase, partial [Patescibacteria group bacterium]
ARYLADITNQFDIPKALAWADRQHLPVVMIGGGSNIYWDDAGYPGLVLVNKIEHFEKLDASEGEAYYTVGAGENWDRVVARTVEAGFGTLAPLSLIPGTAGATPIQNVGAYGLEISEVLTTVQAYDAVERSFVTLRGSECGFEYRTSRFKTVDKGRFFIVAITLRVNNKPFQPPFYKALEEYFEKQGIEQYSVQIVRDAVVNIRTAKLPDPNVVANNGSFFANPIVDKDFFLNLYSNHQQLATWPSKWFWEQPDGNYKIAVGALLESLNLKGVHDAETGMSTWHTQSMVLVNEKATKTAQLEAFKQKIIDLVHQTYGIILQQEPEKISPPSNIT